MPKKSPCCAVCGGMGEMERIWFYETILGEVCIGEREGCISRISWEMPTADVLQEETPLIRRCKNQLEEYLAGERAVFDLPLLPLGTDFQQKVWQALQEIPYGETRSYGEIARRIGQPKATRAVGMANHHNPIAIVIPCHRVVGAGGALTGYAGGLEKKRMLLEVEGSLSSEGVSSFQKKEKLL